MFRSAYGAAHGGEPSAHRRTFKFDYEATPPTLRRSLNYY